MDEIKIAKDTINQLNDYITFKMTAKKIKVDFNKQAINNIINDLINEIKNNTEELK